MRQYSKPSDDELRQRLTSEQYKVTQHEGTELPYLNKYWNNKQAGIYVDIVSGEPLFSSLDKFDSKSGWPSFTKPLADEGDSITLHPDHSAGMTRVEVRSKIADSHLGHVFDDGPGPTGQRFCMNSAALRFVPVDKMKAAGLGKYLFQFADKLGWDIATLAGGCFWGMEEFLEKLPGVIETQVGYTGGTFDKATYRDVTTGKTGHAEAIQVLFDPHATTYEKLLLFFFRMHDPTSENRQGNDVGTQYRSAIFYRGEAQKKVALATKTRVDLSGHWKKPIVTQIAPLGAFWRAETEHQKYLEHHPGGYSCHFVRPFAFE